MEGPSKPNQIPDEDADGTSAVEGPASAALTDSLDEAEGALMAFGESKSEDAAMMRESKDESVVETKNNDEALMESILSETNS